MQQYKNTKNKIVKNQSVSKKWKATTTDVLFLWWIILKTINLNAQLKGLITHTYTNFLHPTEGRAWVQSPLLNEDFINIFFTKIIKSSFQIFFIHLFFSDIMIFLQQLIYVGNSLASFIEIIIIQWPPLIWITDNWISRLLESDLLGNI